LLAMLSATAEGAAQILPVGVAGMSEKPNATVDAVSDASLEIGLCL
jgi:hypothetical protein